MHPRTSLLVPMLIALGISIAALACIFTPLDRVILAGWCLLYLVALGGWVIALILRIKLSVLDDEQESNRVWIAALVTENALLKQERSQLLRAGRPFRAGEGRS